MDFRPKTLKRGGRGRERRLMCVPFFTNRYQDRCVQQGGGSEQAVRQKLLRLKKEKGKILDQRISGPPETNCSTCTHKGFQLTGPWLFGSGKRTTKDWSRNMGFHSPFLIVKSIFRLDCCVRLVLDCLRDCWGFRKCYCNANDATELPGPS